MALLHLTDSNFKKEVLESQLPVLVDYWASWCGPCRLITPVIEELAGEYENRIKIGKINIEENPMIPTRYGVMSIPTLMFFKKGQVVGQLVGAMPKAELKRRIEENLSEATT
ncbi:MAG: thioredoxin [Candidatus Omnitrophota bacterium]